MYREGADMQNKIYDYLQLAELSERYQTQRHGEHFVHLQLVYLLQVEFNYLQSKQKFCQSLYQHSKLPIHEYCRLSGQLVNQDV